MQADTSAPIFLPVSAERVLQAKIRQAQTELAKAQAEHQTQSADDRLWLANGEKRQRERKLTYQRLMAVNPKGAADYLPVTEENETRQEQG